MTDAAALLRDLHDEGESLDALVAPLDESGWHAPTPAEGWDIADTVAHLGTTDQTGLRSLRDPDGFSDWLMAEVAADIDGYLVRQLEPARSMSPADLHAWWARGRADLAAGLAAHDPSVKLPWFGPPMSLLTFITARLMETWAHGEDVADALGVLRAPTARLRHVADIGVRTRAWAYSLHGKTLPDTPLRVELAGPAGETWTWGPDDAPEFVSGSALDFCYLVTQRRPRDQLDLVVDGAGAEEWVGIAQAYAGPPGEGRRSRD